MKISIVFLNLILLVMGFSVSAQRFSNKKVVGYVYHEDRQLKIDYDNLTHAMFAFLNIHDDGVIGTFENENSEKNFNAFIKDTDKKNIVRFVSINPGVKEVATDPEKMHNLATSLIVFCEYFNIQGVDLDWEMLSSPQERTQFTQLMDTLSLHLHKENILLTCTIPFGDYWCQWYEDEALQKADWIQIMVYDQTGPWANSPIGNHATFEHFVQAEEYWMNRGFQRDKLVLGLPFYGYKFPYKSPSYVLPGDQNKVSAVYYKDVVGMYPMLHDTINECPNNENIFFNGPALIRKKCQYVLDSNLAGVMMWDMNKDATGKKSLHQQVVCTLNRTNCLINDASCSANPKDSIIADFRFSGSTTDESGTYQSILNSATLTTNRFGEANKAYAFTKDKIIDYGDVLPVEDFSISAWVYTTSEPSGFQAVVSKYDSDNTAPFSLVLDWNHPTIMLVDESVTKYIILTAPMQLKPNYWYHLSMTHGTDEGTKLYVNSLLVASDTTRIKTLQTHDHLVIGNVRDQQYQDSFYGTIDDVKIFSQVLNQCDVDSLFKLEYNQEDVALSVDDEMYTDNFKVYPNPSGGDFTVEYPSSQNSHLQILNVMGEVVGQFTLNSFSSKIATNLPAGVYLFKITNGEGVHTKKVLIH